MTDNKKSYYAIIPANIRYDKRLNANAKLLFGEITALSNERGYCWASNAYFADLYEVSTTSISSWIKRLKEFGYIKSEVIYKEGSKEILHRYISLITEGIQENLQTPIQENLQDNITVNNNTFNNTNNIDEPIPDINTDSKPNHKPNKKNQEKEDSFNIFWELYNKKKNREKSFQLWCKIDPSLYQDIYNHVKIYRKTKEGTEYPYHPNNYLKDKHWNDELLNNDSTKKDLSDEEYREQLRLKSIANEELFK